MGLPVEIDDLLISSTGAAAAYTVGRSLRFRASASAYLSRTPATASNRQKWTLSFWTKINSGTGNWSFLSARVDDNDRTTVLFQNNQILLQNILSGTVASAFTNALFRDPSAWYHIHIVYDSAQATASNRFYVYVNNVLQTTTGSYPAQNDNSFINYNTVHGFGRIEYSSPTGYYDGYFAEVNFIDGQALTPSSFGAYDTNGIWQPAKYSGSYGTNGFYLPFSNTSSTSTLVADSSGNGNNWTPNNISLTAGATYDSMIDSPTVSASSSNYATLSPIDQGSGTITLSQGNLCATGTSTNWGTSRGTIWVNSGKWYWEVTFTTSSGSPPSETMVGIMGPSQNLAGNTGSVYPGLPSDGYAYLSSNGQKYNNAVNAAYGATYIQGDVIGVALDLNAGTLTFYKNNTSQGTAYSSLSGTFAPAVGMHVTSGANPVSNINFGQQPFVYTPPTGFNALNTYNLPTPAITNGALYNAATLYTGNGTSQSPANSQSNGGNNALGKTFYPDLTWIKSRSAATDHKLTDSVRGVTKALISDSTAAETTDTNGLTAFSSSSFTVGTDTNYNNSGATYVGWQWNAGSGSSSSNTNGSITSTVSANPTTGFSIATFTGTGANATIGHGLGSVPNMIIVKNRASSQNWPVYHSSIGNTGGVFLNLTNSTSTDSTLWNNTTPTSSVFSVGSSGATNGSTNGMVAYCFAAIKGYSAFGSYTGNGSTDGPFNYLGFRPRWVMIKNISAVGNWFIIDTSRDLYNVAQDRLFPSASNAEATSPVEMDILSNGFKIRIDTDTGTNTSGNVYIYAAFAENPFKYSRAR